MGFAVIALGMFTLIAPLFLNLLTDRNFLFYRECSKMLMMVGALMILFALSKDEGRETEIIRTKATRNAMFLTVLFLFGSMLFRVATGDLLSVDSSSFLTFLIVDVLCLEFGMKKAAVDKLFKK